ncbi:permease prefix domain 1-containing protein [Camelliibacillus cellulosilyticus]|uniref:Permease prefix domain 1-containing protein n=1 Tax=Camelliibacillus cellulosilyticus TaxID=2174486 RepID=A0ABV9GP41_9BACL
MKKIKNHVDELFKGIPKSAEKEAIKQDIIENLEEKVYDLMAQGKEEEDAINKAIVDFGDIDEIKRELSAKKPVKKKMTKLDLAFSIWGSVLIIALFLFINFYYTPHIIWFVYPTFAVLWWPLSMFYRWLRLK